ncbi:radical SAM protein [Eubacterium limosum]|uniref:radical SAM protein n=1 Tax=Eubacterium limosum TaxID=1736 RepID=UPI00106377AC|nr:radical SAM protein [Eubacterium limosum]
MKIFSLFNDDGTYVALSAPLKVYLDITTLCNLDCIFCYKDKTAKDPSLNFVISLIDKIADSNIKDVVFVGGDPLATPNLEKYLIYAFERGLNVGLLTNGTLFKDSNISYIKKYVGSSIAISLHGPNDDICKQLSRRAHIYSDVVQGIQKLNKVNIAPGILYTPTKINYTYLSETVTSLIDQGLDISYLLVNRLIPAKNNVTSWENLKIDLNIQKYLLNEMLLLSEKYPQLKISTGDAVPFCLVEEKFWKFIVRCDYGTTLGWIDEKGFFGKCMTRTGNLGLDNLVDKSITDVWLHSQAFIDHRQLKCICDRCFNCQLLKECGGGCVCSSPDFKDFEDGYFKDCEPFSKLRSCRREVPIKNAIDFSLNSIPSFQIDFSIRDESVAVKRSQNEKYLFIPESNNNVSDTITDEYIPMFWLDSIEKLITEYINGNDSVKNIGMNIAKILNINIEVCLKKVESVMQEYSKYKFICFIN